MSLDWLWGAGASVIITGIGSYIAHGVSLDSIVAITSTRIAALELEVANHKKEYSLYKDNNAKSIDAVLLQLKEISREISLRFEGISREFRESNKDTSRISAIIETTVEKQNLLNSLFTKTLDSIVRKQDDIADTISEHATALGIIQNNLHNQK